MKMESRLNGKCLKLLYVSVINCWLKDSDGASHIPNLKCYTVVNGEPFAARLVIVWKGIETGQHKNRMAGGFQALLMKESIPGGGKVHDKIRPVPPFLWNAQPLLDSEVNKN